MGNYGYICKDCIHKKICEWVPNTDDTCTDHLTEIPTDKFTRVELESWLSAIAINNTDNDLGKSCEEIIKRLDGFVRYVEYIRSEHDGTQED